MPQLINSQTESSLQLENFTFEEFANLLEEKFDILLSFNEEDTKDVIVNYDGPSNADQIISQTLKNTILDYEMMDNQYLVISKKLKKKIKGQLIDEFSNQALAYATIHIIGTEKGTVTDEDGRFELETYFGKKDSITLSYIGYKSQTFHHSVFSKKQGLNVRMSFKENSTPMLIVKDYISDGIDLDKESNAHIITPDKLNILPGTVEPEIFESIQFLPGISSPSSRASDFYVRGGTPDQTLVLWEDIPIYHTGHYFGMISSMDPFLIDKVNVHRGGFGANLGTRVAGIIQLESLDEQNKSQLVLGTNGTHAYLSTHRQLGKTKKTTISGSVRRSYSELFASPTFNNITRFNQQGFIIGNTELAVLPDNINSFSDFNFIDSQFNFNSQLSKKDKIELSALYAHNDFNGRIEDSIEDEFQDDIMSLRNWGFKINWMHRYNRKLESYIRLVGSDFEYDYRYILKKNKRDRAELDGDKENRIVDQQLQIGLKYKINASQKVEFGIQGINYDVSFRSIEESKNRSKIEESGDDQSLIIASFVNYNKRFGDKLHLQAGIRTSYFEVSEDYYTAPRLNLSYFPVSKLSFNASYGRYFQFINQLIEFKGSNTGLSLPIWILANNQQDRIQEGNHFQFGTTYNINSLTIDVQAYQREVKGISSRAFDLEMIDTNDSEFGSFYSKGIDMLLKKRWNKFNSWISYSLSQTDLRFKNLTKNEFPANHDQRHSLSFINQIKHNNFQLSLGYTYGSGFPFSKVVSFDTRNQNQDNEFDLDYDGINQHRLNSTHDINVSAQIALKSKANPFKTILGFSITNLMNTDNAFERNYFVVDPINSLPDLTFSEKSNLFRTYNLSLRIVFD